MTRYLLLLFALAGCNITSKVPVSHDQGMVERMQFYAFMHQHYQNMHDTLTIKSIVVADTSFREVTFKVTKLLYQAKADLYLNLGADALGAILKQQ